MPSSTDDVIIDGNVTVDHGQGIHAVKTLDLRSGSTLNLTGGDLMVGGAVAVGGILTMAGGLNVR